LDWTRRRKPKRNNGERRGKNRRGQIQGFREKEARAAEEKGGERMGREGTKIGGLLGAWTRTKQKKVTYLLRIRGVKWQKGWGNREERA